MPLHAVTVCLLSLIFILVVQLEAEPVHDEGEVRVRRDVETEPSPEDRPGCKTGVVPPATRVVTTDRLRALRALFAANQGIHAYVIPTEDAHQSEYVTEHDKRRQYISGFSGSAGIGIVLANKAALWTDGRYFLQSESQLDCNWILMKSGAGAPSTRKWLSTELKGVQAAKVGADPFYMSTSTWKLYSDELSKKGITMVETPNLIDDIWTTGRPLQSSTPINALEIKFSGKKWEDKIGDLRKEITKLKTSACVVTSLDDVAWLFNVRASDIAYNPFLISYAIVEESRIRLYVINAEKKLSEEPTDPETKLRLYKHLNTGISGSCSGVGGDCVQVVEYNPITVKNDIVVIANTSPATRIWVSPSCSQAIYSAIPKTQVVQHASWISKVKEVKNPVEARGMYHSHNRDSAALIKFMAFLEKEVKDGEVWTEVTAASKLKEYRLLGQYNRGLSFGSISASGSNGAIIHYTPTNLTDKHITTNDMYLLDSGGQYLDGTTDVTRTFHFGSPSDFEKECYTRVLMGSIDLALMVWPAGLTERDIDMMARRPLWNVGLIYRHGTSHGVGAYLSVHEGSSRSVLQENMFYSDEPGYYEHGKFGIRLETIVVVEKKNTKYKYGNTTFLGYSPVQLVPFENNLINYSLLNQKQIDWLNSYNAKVKEVIGPLVTGTPGYDWMIQRTNKI